MKVGVLLRLLVLGFQAQVLGLSLAGFPLQGGQSLQGLADGVHSGPCLLSIEPPGLQELLHL